MKSEFVDGLLMRRRDALRALAGWSLVAAGSKAFGHERHGSVLPYTPNTSDTFDYNNPYDNAYAFGKIWGGYDEPQYGAYHGVMYGRVDGKRHEALFGYTGSGVMQSRINASGTILSLIHI